jgi:hypothetical protein
MRKSLNHVHTYVRNRKIFGEQYFQCAHPDCYDLKAKKDLIGKRSMCAICGQTEIFLTADDLKRARPRCANCSNSKKPRNDRPQTPDTAESAPANGMTVTNFGQPTPRMHSPKPVSQEIERLEDEQKGLTREELQFRERRRKQIQILMKFFSEEDAIAQWQKLEEMKQLKHRDHEKGHS